MAASMERGASRRTGTAPCPARTPSPPGSPRVAPGGEGPDADPAAHGHRAVDGQAEVGRRVGRVVRQDEEEHLAPPRHAGRPGAPDRAPGEEERRVRRVDRPGVQCACLARLVERLRQVGLVGEAEAHGEVLDVVVVVAEVVDLEPLLDRHVRYLRRARGHDEHVLVEDLVVLHVRAQRERGGVLPRVGEDGGAGDPRQAALVQVLDELAERPLLLAAVPRHDLAAAPPRRHHREQHDGDQQRQPAAVHDLGQVRGEEGGLDAAEGDRGQGELPGRPVPERTGHDEHQDRVDEQGAGDRDAVGGGEPLRRPERQHHRHDADEEGGVHARQIDLAALVLGGLPDRDRRQQTELHRLPGQRVRPRDDRLAGDHRGGRGEGDHGQLGPARNQQEERVRDRARVTEDERGLAEVVQHQGREDHEEPRPADRRPAEVAHVGVQGLGAGDHQDDRAHGHERDARMIEDEEDGVRGRQPLDDRGLGDDPADAGHGEGAEPQQRHWAEQRPDPAGAETLHGEEHREDDRRHRHDDMAQGGLDDADPLDGGQHADRRRDQGIAVEQRQAEDAEHHQRRTLSAAAGVEPARQRGQGHHAALAVVVGPHEDADVLDRDDQGDRPEHHRDHAVDVALGRAHRPVVDREDRLQRVERAGADVAEHDAERGEHQASGRAVTVGVLRRRRGVPGFLRRGCRRLRRAAHLPASGGPSAVPVTASSSHRCADRSLRRPGRSGASYLPAVHFFVGGPRRARAGIRHSHGMSDWVRHAVWWQVYPLGAVGAERERLPEGAPAVPRLAELQAWLPHLVGLGCNGLALGPVFESSTHGYDTVDHFAVDRRLGTEQDLVDLVAACRAAGVRVLLDGVFNHVGREFPRFREVREQGPGAPAAGWFDIDPSGTGPDGFGYRDFEGHSALVALDHGNPEVADYVAEVMTYWCDRGVDAWRLDAAYAVPPAFWREVLPRVRDRHPDLWVVGEVLHGDYARYVAESGIDSVTQYELWKAIWSSLNDRNLFELAHALTRHAALLPDFLPQTFIGNHDVTRIASRLADTRHLPLAVALLFAVPGVPSVYYGDELGLRGVKEDRAGGDDAVRPAYPAGPDDLSADGVDGADVHDLHRQLIGVRRRHPWLNADGATVAVDEVANELLAVRVSGDARAALLVLNVGDAPARIRPRVPVTEVAAGAGRLEGGEVAVDGHAFALLV